MRTSVQESKIKAPESVERVAAGTRLVVGRLEELCTRFFEASELFGKSVSIVATSSIVMIQTDVNSQGFRCKRLIAVSVT